jgi:hypothetical protein
MDLAQPSKCSASSELDPLIGLPGVALSYGYSLATSRMEGYHEILGKIIFQGMTRPWLMGQKQSRDPLSASP